ncbi:MAG: acetyl-CoA carboxylase biotin carboxyl carrier protein [Longimicrobiales bacterium]
MIDIEFVERLIRALDESSLDSLEVERGGTRVRLSKSPPPQAFRESGSPPASQGAPIPAPSPGLGEGAVAAAAEARVETVPGDAGETTGGNLIEVTSPMVGTFYRAPSPDAPPYVDLGARVGKGSVLCIIEAMKLMNEMESEVEGTIVKILVENAEPVEYGQVLFLVDPT